MTRLRDSKQPGWHQSGSSYLTDEIGTSGCEASPERYGYGLNRRTGFESVLVASNRWIRLSRPPLPSKGNQRGVGLYVPTKNVPPQGERRRRCPCTAAFLPVMHGRGGMPHIRVRRVESLRSRSKLRIRGAAMMAVPCKGCVMSDEQEQDS
jgi:hypothetical protein